MPLCPLTRCFFPLLALVPPDSSNPFEHQPFTFPTFRRNMMLAPLPTDDLEEDMYDDVMATPEPMDQPDIASLGFVLDERTLRRLKKVDSDKLSLESLTKASHFFRNWLWPKVQYYREDKKTVQYAIDRIDFPTLPKGGIDETDSDEGYGHMRRVTRTLLNVPGGIMDIVEEIMKQARATPAHAWRNARDENRRELEGPAKPEYDVPLPGCAANDAGASLVDAVADAVFGPGARGIGGKALSTYAAVCKVLIDRTWERLSRRLKSAAERSKDLHATLDALLQRAERTGAKDDMDSALRALTNWRVEAESTLETEDLPFTEATLRLSGLYSGKGLDIHALAAAKNKRTHKRRAGRKKGGPQPPSDAEVAAAREDYELFCQAHCQNSSSQIPVGPPRPRVPLLTDDGDIGVGEYVGKSVQDLFADLGLPGASHFPFANRVGPTKKPIAPLRHQVVGVSAILKRAFTRKAGEPALPTMLCDDVGLGKTVQILGVIQMIAHLRAQQQLSPDKKIRPPPFAIANRTPFLAGLDTVPNLPHLIVVPHTLSSQWIGEVAKFTKSGSFRVVRYSADEGGLDRFFSSPEGAYLQAAGADGSKADRVIVVADLSAIECQAVKCFHKPGAMGSKAEQIELAHGKLDYLESKGELPAGSIWEQRFASVSYDESHNLRNDRMLTLVCQILSANAVVRIAATATPIFTGPRVRLKVRLSAAGDILTILPQDLASQGRILRHEPLMGKSGEDAYLWMRERQQTATNEWPYVKRGEVERAIEAQVDVIVKKEGAADQPARVEELRKEFRKKYESEDQLKVLQTEYINRESIELLRDLMLPVVVRRTCRSRDPSGAPIIPIPPYLELILWSILDAKEQEVLDEVNEVHQLNKERRERGEAFDASILKWEDFLMSQKDACMWAAFVLMKRLAKEAGRSAEADMLKIPDSWTPQNIDSVLSSRLRTVDAAVEHFWEGNPKPPVYRRDGSRDLQAEAQLPDPPPLQGQDRRKFLIYVEFKVHRHLVKKLMEMRGRKCVEYDGEMTAKQRQRAVDTFKGEDDCRVMLISRVGGAGLNLDVASVLIFVSPLWSGLEKRQLMGRLWRLGQLNHVIILDIIAPGGPDLALAGYAGSKIALAESFLQEERQLYEAHRISDAVRRDAERESESEDESVDVPLAGVPQVQKTSAQPRKRKAVALEAGDEGAAGGHSQGVSQPGPSAPLANKRARTGESSGPSQSAGHPSGRDPRLSQQGRAAICRGRRGRGAGPGAGGSGRARSDSSSSSGSSSTSSASSSPAGGYIVFEPGPSTPPANQRDRTGESGRHSRSGNHLAGRSPPVPQVSEPSPRPSTPRADPRLSQPGLRGAICRGPRGRGAGRRTGGSSRVRTASSGCSSSSDSSPASSASSSPRRSPSPPAAPRYGPSQAAPPHPSRFNPHSSSPPLAPSSSPPPPPSWSPLPPSPLRLPASPSPPPASQIFAHIRGGNNAATRLLHGTSTQSLGAPTAAVGGSA
ncbi:hypothetical protein FRC12_003219 [Ceratobasidium sp. 428]|nr:hypothetical protein FRC12_003219 [Ceratobasidium sp. 428]